MAQQHLYMLRKGVKAWNEWKGTHLFHERPDFSSANLAGINLPVVYEVPSGTYDEIPIGANLRDANFYKANLTSANLPQADLVGANLTNANLTGANLTGANLGWANLTKADLTGADLANANLTEANLTGANLTGAVLSDANLTGVDLSYSKLKETSLTRVDLRRVHLEKAKFHRTSFVGANLVNVDLSNIHLDEVDLSAAQLREANLSNTWICRAQFRRADLSRANLSGSRLSESNFSAASLAGADLTGADLAGAFLDTTNLTQANLSDADLIGANFSSACLSNADFSHAHLNGTIFGNIDFRSIKGLETMLHHGPSTIGIDSLTRSEGNIPEIFLRQAGVIDSAIAYARTLINTSIKSRTCLICYSDHDREFAEYLYHGLQQRGVQCWYAPNGMTTGPSRSRAGQATDMYDAQLLVVSQHSIKYLWIEQAIEETLAQETKKATMHIQYTYEYKNTDRKIRRRIGQKPEERRHKLFPIHLDNTILNQKDRNDSWNIRRRIALLPNDRPHFDFTGWKQDEDTQSTLNQLVIACHTTFATETKICYP